MGSDMILLAGRFDELTASMIRGARLHRVQQLLHVEDPVLILARSPYLLRSALRVGLITELMHSLSHLALAAVFTTVEEAIGHL